MWAFRVGQLRDEARRLPLVHGRIAILFVRRGWVVSRKPEPPLRESAIDVIQDYLATARLDSGDNARPVCVCRDDNALGDIRPSKA